MTAEEHFNLANALQESRRFEEAVAHYRQALQINPNFFHAANNLGNTLQWMGRRQEAITAYQNALRVDATVPEIHFNLANTLASLGGLDEAVESFKRAIQLRPDYVEAINNLAVAMRTRMRHTPSAKADDLDASLLACERAVELNPGYGESHLNLANALKEVGRIDEADTHYRKAIQLKPDPAIFSTMLYALHFHPAFGPRALQEEHVRFNEMLVQPLASQIRPHANDPSLDRPLRIGYVSTEFRNHCQSFFTIPLLSNHDHQGFEIFCYSGVEIPDQVTQRIRGYCDQWRDISSLTDEQGAELVRRDRIDVLVDLTMHMASRIMIFAHKPAPVQVAWLAYPGTTGLETIDYRISDPYIDPGFDDVFYSEKTFRLPSSFWCYDPLAGEPNVNELPAARSGHITFGCLNNSSKLTDLSIELWSQVLKAVPNSRMRLLVPQGSARTRVRELFGRNGVDASRIDFVAWLPRVEYLRQHHHIDICLDPHPCPGHTTTMDALWMGVPVVGLPGSTAISRGGISILSNVGLPDLVAHNPQGYVRIAQDLAGDLPRLTELRRTLRGRMQASPLMNAPAFSHDMEEAFRTMWRSWCERRAPSQIGMSRACFDRANALFGADRLREAIAEYRGAISHRPTFAEAYNNLGLAQRATGESTEAMESFRKAVSMRPNYADALNNLAVSWREAGKLAESLAASQQAVAAQADFAPAHINLGNVHMAGGRIDRAIECYRRADAIDPNSVASHNLLYALHFSPAYDPKAIYEEHARWAARYSHLSANSAFTRDRSDSRKLRIGYVSADFRDHPIGKFALPLLSNHDRKQFEVICYSGVLRPDGFTDRARRFATLWRDIAHLSDEQLADQVRADQIDILVDLTMHMEGTRLLTFARKPAPVQITYLAYCGTTGLSAIDYRFTDPFLDPLRDDSYYSEKSLYLKSYWCYEPPAAAPGLGPPPSSRAAYITFGCLNNFSKVSSVALSMWRRILSEVPNSRLLLHAHEGSHCDEVRRQFAADGIDPRRIEFVGFLPTDQYLQRYQQIDIALDPFPYTGGTTTCDALWMGVPVVTRAGPTAISRSGVSILSTIGLPDLIAADEHQYVRIATNLAADPQRLQTLRREMRQRMQTSPLIDAAGFAGEIEAAYRTIWERI